MLDLQVCVSNRTGLWQVARRRCWWVTRWLLLFCLVLQGPATTAYAQVDPWLSTAIVTSSNPDPNPNNNDANLCLGTGNNQTMLTTAGVQAAVIDPNPVNNDAALCLPITPTASVGQRVWEDWNDNGVQEAGEPGIGGVVVQLFDSQNRLVASTTTDATGNYHFTGLPAGDYYLIVTPPNTP